MGFFRDKNWTTWQDANNVVWGGHFGNGYAHELPEGGTINLRRKPVKVFDPNYAQPKTGLFRYPETWLVTDDKTGERHEIPVPDSTITALWAIDLLVGCSILAAIAGAVVALAT